VAFDQSHYPSPKNVLAARRLHPRKRFGQNFLTDPRVAMRIAQLVPAGAHVIEIGGGTGTLTAPLAARAASVTCLEIDRDLCAVLRERFDAMPAVTVDNQDALTYDYATDLRSHRLPSAVCGNLPYYITTPLLERILELGDLLDCAVIMVQREYAQRLTAKPMTADYGSLTVFANYFSELEKAFDVGAAGFYPPPLVASSVIRLTPRKQRLLMPETEALFLKLVRAAFGHRRKTLINSVLAGSRGEMAELRKTVQDALSATGLSQTVRAERLSLTDFCRLAEELVRRRVAQGGI